ncbi:Coiled-coil domain-containing protein [Quillaja saponaria]|uniref:Coiled-coil domain-containing protein n=1 Tax=Quillaja saponaria TaxID=32244 RepID=A0AAD7KTD7_QUISA|nr:Coiled-coil domain-containing protein [Quillaja saponaria]
MVKVATFFAMSLGAFVFWQSMDKVHVWIALHQDEKVNFNSGLLNSKNFFSIFIYSSTCNFSVARKFLFTSPTVLVPVVDAETPDYL